MGVFDDKLIDSPIVLLKHVCRCDVCNGYHIWCVDPK